jgi:7-cyano-7-deazaguanine reductase
VCPKTGQPDFGTMLIRYIPAASCIELKSLKLYLQQFRNQGIFYEDITNRILNDLVRACSPQWMLLTSSWTPRGGISSKITVEYVGKHKKRPR